MGATIFMFFNKKDDATTSKKKVNTLAPAFKYPKVKHREKHIFTQDSPQFDDDIDNYLPEYNPTAHLKVEPEAFNINPDALPPLHKPTVTESPIFSLEDFESEPELTTSLFLEEEPAETPSFSSAFSVQAEEPSFYQEPEAPNRFNESPSELLNQPDLDSTKPLTSVASYEADTTVEDTDLTVENVYETVLTQEIDDMSIQSVLEEEALPSPHVAKPAPEKLTPAEELSFQARTLAFEDEDHYYNPLAIGETLPSYSLTEKPSTSPVSTQDLDVFEDLQEADLDLQESFAVAQKSSEAVEAVFGVSSIAETIETVEASVEDSIALDALDAFEQTDVEVVFEAETSHDVSTLETTEIPESPFSFLSIEEPPSLSTLDESLDSSLQTSLDSSFEAAFEDGIFDIPELPETKAPPEDTPFTPVDENTFNFSMFLDEHPEVEAGTAPSETLSTPAIDAIFETGLPTEVAPVEEGFSQEERIESPTASLESLEISEFPSSETVLAEDDDDLQFTAEPFASPAVESNFLALEESLETLIDANLELASSGVETPLTEDLSQDFLTETFTESPPLDAFSQEEDDPFETLPSELSPIEGTAPNLSFETFRQLEESDDALDATETSPPSHFTLEGDAVLEDASALLDPSLFFSLDSLEDGTAPEELSIDLEPLPDFETLAPLPDSLPVASVELDVPNAIDIDPSPHLLHPVAEEAEDEFAAYFPENENNEALLGEYASLALEDLDVLVTQAFPYGESRLYLVHVNEVFAIIALKQHKYTLLQSFSSLPEGVELFETAEASQAPQLKEGSLQLTWNASSYDEHIFDLRLGDWHALVVEDSKGISLQK
jgi:hypothetical protein